MSNRYRDDPPDRSKQPRNCKSHLIVPVNTQQQGVSSEGYMSDSEGEESEEGLEVVEDAADLEEEGVYLTGEARKISLKVGRFESRNFILSLSCTLSLFSSSSSCLLLALRLILRSSFVLVVLKSFQKMKTIRLSVHQS